MNRKAKFAYGYIIVGFVVFLISLIFILNQNVNLTKLKAHSNFPTTNFSSDLSLFVIKNPSNNIQDFDQLELSWYCGLKYSLNENRIDEESSSKDISNVKEIYYVDLKHAQHWLKLFSFIICSSEQVYFGILLWICMSSGLLCIFGFVRFYKYDIKLLEHAAKFNSINSFSNENYDSLLETKVTYDESKRDAKTCSIILEDESLTKTDWMCCRNIFRSSKRHEVVKEEKKGVIYKRKKK